MAFNYFPRTRNRIWKGAWRLVTKKDKGIQDQGDLIGQGNLLLGQLRLVHSLPQKSTKLHVNPCYGTITLPKGKLCIADRTRYLPPLGAFSCAISLPSVSECSFQVYACHGQCLPAESSHDLGVIHEKVPMAVCVSRSAITECTINYLTSWPAQPFIKACHSFSSCGERCFDKYENASMRWRNKGQRNNFQLNGDLTFSVPKRKQNGKQFIGFGLKGLHALSSASYSSGAAHDVSVDNSTRDGQHLGSAASPELKLSSGSCYLPHPDKEETGGEDAHFICTSEHAVGVADGVGGWADHGIDAGMYSRELMFNSVNAIKEEPRGSVNPARVLEKAYNSTKAKGSSTACIIALTDKALHAINLGDSGFMVVRDGCTVFRSPVQLHDFNFTYQLEGGNAGDLPGAGQVFTIPVAPGDVIIAGTDGLFDNLYNNEITAVVVQAMRAGFRPEVTAQQLATLAQQRAQDKNRQTPFSRAAQEAGFRYYGGKLDDITVIISYVSLPGSTGM